MPKTPEQHCIHIINIRVFISIVWKVYLHFKIFSMLSFIFPNNVHIGDTTFAISAALSIYIML